MISETAARTLLATTAGLGEALKVGGEYFTVVGIVATSAAQSSGLQAPDKSNDIV